MRDGKPTSFALFAAPGRKVDGTLADAPPPTLPAEAPLREGSKLVFAEESPVVKGLKPSTSYTLWVAVKNSAGWSGWSDSRVATTAARGRAPWAPNAPVLDADALPRGGVPAAVAAHPWLRRRREPRGRDEEHQTPMDAKGGGGKGGGGGGWRRRRARRATW